MGNSIVLVAATSSVAGASPVILVWGDSLSAAYGIPFESGWEVWVYRWPGAEPGTRAATELVVLFPPSGPAHKVRTRPGVASAR